MFSINEAVKYVDKNIEIKSDILKTNFFILVFIIKFVFSN